MQSKGGESDDLDITESCDVTSLVTLFSAGVDAEAGDFDGHRVADRGDASGRGRLERCDGEQDRAGRSVAGGDRRARSGKYLAGGARLLHTDCRKSSTSTCTSPQ